MVIAVPPAKVIKATAFIFQEGRMAQLYRSYKMPQTCALCENLLAGSRRGHKLRL